MATKYPYKIDNNTSLPDVIDNITPVKADSVNILKNAILAIENELGVKPSGVSGSVKDRFISLENIITNIEAGSFTPAGDLDGTSTNQKVIGIQNIPVSTTLPTLGQALIFDGTSYTPTTPSGGGSTFVPGGDLSGTDTLQNVIKLRGYNISSTAPTANQVLQYIGTAWTPTNLIPYTPNDASVTLKGILQLSRDLGGTADLPKVIGLQGVDVSATLPTSNQVLQYNGAAWTPTTLAPSGAPTTSSYITLSTDTALSNERVLTAGTNISIVDGGAGNAVTINSTYSYTPIDATTGVKGIIQLTGDLGGTSALPKVLKLNGIAINNGSTATTGNVLQFNSGSGIFYGGVDLGNSNSVFGILPSFNQASQTVGSDLSGTTASATVIRIRGINVVATAPTIDQVLQYNGTNWTPTTLAGYTPIDASTTQKGIVQLTNDLGGTATAPTVLKVNGISISGVPTTGYVPTATSATTATWQAAPINAPTTASYLTLGTDATLSNERVLTAGANISFTDGGAGSTLTINNTYSYTPTDATTGAKGIIQLSNDLGGTATAPSVLKINGTTVIGTPGSAGLSLRSTGVGTSGWGAIDLANASSITGILPATNQATQAMGGDVTGTTASNVVSRLQGVVYVTGAPVAGSGLYATSGTSSQWGSLNLAGGSNYVSGILPSINQASQTLIGDVTGTTATSTVTKLQGRALSASAPTNGQAIVWNNALSSWEPGTVSGGSVSDATSTIKGIVKLSGDLGGTADTPLVTAIQNYKVKNTAPSDGFVLTYNTVDSVWEPKPTAGLAGSSLQFVRPHDTTFNPVALYQFDGNLNDSSGFARHLTIGSGTPKYSEIFPKLQGVFLTSSERFFTSAAALQIAGDVTYEAIMLIPVQLTTQTYSIFAEMEAGETAAGNYLSSLLITYNAGYHYFEAFWEYNAGVNVSYANTSGPIPTNEPFHFAMVRQSNVVTMYINGRAFGTPSGVLTAPNTTAPIQKFYVGGNLSSDTGFTGLISSLKVIDRALTATEVNSEFERTVGNAYNKGILASVNTNLSGNTVASQSLTSAENGYVLTWNNPNWSAQPVTNYRIKGRNSATATVSVTGTAYQNIVLTSNIVVANNEKLVAFGKLTNANTSGSPTATQYYNTQLAIYDVGSATFPITDFGYVTPVARNISAMVVWTNTSGSSRTMQVAYQAGKTAGTEPTTNMTAVVNYWIETLT